MITMVLFVISIILFWVDLFVMQYAWQNMYDGIYRIADVSILLLVLSITILGILSVRLLLKRFASQKQSNFRSIFTILVLILVLSIHYVPISKLSNAGVKVFGATNIDSKRSEDNGNYYLYVKDESDLIKVKCDKNIYDSIIIDRNVLYTMEYRFYLGSSDSAFLIDIDLMDYIDNRR